MADFTGLRVEVTTAKGLAVQGVVVQVNAHNQQLTLENVLATDAFGHQHALPTLVLPGKDISDLRIISEEKHPTTTSVTSNGNASNKVDTSDPSSTITISYSAQPVQDPAIISFTRDAHATVAPTPVRQFSVPILPATSAASGQSDNHFPTVDTHESDTSEPFASSHSHRTRQRGRGGRKKDDALPGHVRVKSRESALNFASKSARDNSLNRGSDKGYESRGWANEDVSEYHDAEFDFQHNLTKFDKQKVFDEIRTFDSVAPEDRLVSINVNGRSTHDTTPAYHGSTRIIPKLAYNENVLQSSSHDNFQDIYSSSGTESRSSIAVGRHRTSLSAISDYDRTTENTNNDANLTLRAHQHRTRHRRPTLEKNKNEPNRRSSYAAYGNNIAPPSPVNEVKCRTLSGTIVPCATAMQTLELERVMAFETGPSEDVLIENAGRSIAELIMQLLGGSRRLNLRNHNAPAHVAFLCGHHKNGAYALCAARHLAHRGILVTAIVAAAPPPPTSILPSSGSSSTLPGLPSREASGANLELSSLLAKANIARTRMSSAQSLRIPTGIRTDEDDDTAVTENEEQPKLSEASRSVVLQIQLLNQSGGDILYDLQDLPDAVVDMVVDGLLGFYTLRDLHSEADRRTVCECIAWTKSLRAPILSLDVPSGVDATTGAIAYPPHYINPRWTVGLGLPKAGVLSRSVAGELFVADIGIPPALWKNVGVRDWPHRCGPWEDKFVQALELV